MLSTAFEDFRIRNFGIETVPGIAHRRSKQLVSKCAERSISYPKEVEGLSASEKSYKSIFYYV